jgi:hypothetical protein
LPDLNKNAMEGNEGREIQNIRIYPLVLSAVAEDDVHKESSIKRIRRYKTIDFKTSILRRL